MINENDRQQLEHGLLEKKKKDSKKNAYCSHVLKPLGTG